MPRKRRPGRPRGPQDADAREKLLLAARRELAAVGLSAFTLRGVANRANVQPPLLNYYFGTRDDLLTGVIESISAELHPRLLEIAQSEGGPEQRLRRFVEHFVATLAAEPYLPHLMIETVVFSDDERTDRFASEFGRPLMGALLEMLEDGQSSGAFARFDPAFAGPSLIGACVFFFLSAPLVRRLFGFEPAERADEFAAFAANLLLGGLRAESAA